MLDYVSHHVAINVMCSEIMGMVSWYNSGADSIPYVSHRKQYCPSEILNMHNHELDSSSLICQNPDKASSLLKHFACQIVR